MVRACWPGGKGTLRRPAPWPRKAWRGIGARRSHRHANALNTLGLAARSQARLPAARALHAESLTLRARQGDQWGVANALLNLGVVAWSQGEYAKRAELLEESLGLDRALGDRWGSAVVLDNLGLVARSQGICHGRGLVGRKPVHSPDARRWLGGGDATLHLAEVVQAPGRFRWRAGAAGRKPGRLPRGG